ncbi:MAG: transposase [Puniceicoccaceae bacterium]
MQSEIPQWFQPANMAAVNPSNRILPHWTSPGGTYAVTFRPADSIPAEVQSKWTLLKQRFLARNPQPWSADIQALYSRTISNRMERLLDLGYGSCRLKDPDIRQVVNTALLFFNGERYKMDTFVIMPNHVHALFLPIPPFPLEQILHSWKSYTAHILCKELGCPAPVWQEENWDTLMRSHKQFLRFRHYCRRNPEKAKLLEGSYSLWSEVELQARRL